MLACGTEGSPLDVLTAARLARDGERPSPVRHMCSGQHTVFSCWPSWAAGPGDYWQEDHPAQAAYREAVAPGLRAPPPDHGARRLRRAPYAFPLRDVARAYAMLADPGAIPSTTRERPFAHLSVSATRCSPTRSSWPGTATGWTRR